MPVGIILVSIQPAFYIIHGIELNNIRDIALLLISFQHGKKKILHVVQIPDLIIDSDKFTEILVTRFTLFILQLSFLFN